MAGCQGSPGIRCHLSSQAWMPSAAIPYIVTKDLIKVSAAYIATVVLADAQDNKSGALSIHLLQSEVCIAPRNVIFKPIVEKDRVGTKALFDRFSD
jgi:hypothetical protein